MSTTHSPENRPKPFNRLFDAARSAVERISQAGLEADIPESYLAVTDRLVANIFESAQRLDAEQRIAGGRRLGLMSEASMRYRHWYVPSVLGAVSLMEIEGITSGKNPFGAERLAVISDEGLPVAEIGHLTVADLPVFPLSYPTSEDISRIERAIEDLND